ncbi:MAG: MFS transporter [Gammaproteobacteria bacterium]|nr:MFS transporter [Gammaproteobacteria bacterium]
MPDPNSSRMLYWLGAATRIEPREVWPAIAAFLFIFTLMAAYYVLRPVRDALASDWTDLEVAALWNINFVASTVLVAAYGWAVGRIPFRWLVPAVYGTFALSFLAFFAGVQLVGNRDLVYRAFYVWVSVFGLFHVSVFWSYMAEVFAKEQARRLFGFIAAGASAGAITGPAIPALLGSALAPEQLLLLASLLLVLPLPAILALDRFRASTGNHAAAANRAAALGGHPFAGFRLLLTNPFLLGIGVFIMLHTAIGAFVYFEQKNLLEPYPLDVRTRILGALDWVTNILSILVGLFVTGRFTHRFGMPAALALIPVCVLAGLLLLAFLPLLPLLLALQVVRRVGEYAVLRPGREAMFTVVDRETRFKAKPVIDVVVYRGSDALSGAGFAALTEFIGLALGPVAAIGAGIAAVWTALAVHLGRTFEREHGCV